MCEEKKILLFGIKIDAVTLAEAARRVYVWSSEPQKSECRYVVTPNVDHVVQYQENAPLRAAYRNASLVLADGAPIVAAARLLSRQLPGRVAGSDLVPTLFDVASEGVSNDGAAREKLRVFLLGAAEGVAERAAEHIHSQWKNVLVVDVYSPPHGFEHDESQCSAIVERVNAAAPDVLLVGLGAPKQELWVAKYASSLQARVALCIGATIDFLANEKPRAPEWMQRTGLEWLHRVASEPRRLAGRYLRDAWLFPQLVWREFQSNSGS